MSIICGQYNSTISLNLNVYLACSCINWKDYFIFHFSFNNINTSLENNSLLESNDDFFVCFLVYNNVKYFL